MPQGARYEIEALTPAVGGSIVRPRMQDSNPDLRLINPPSPRAGPGARVSTGLGHKPNVNGPKPGPNQAPGKPGVWMGGLLIGGQGHLDGGLGS